MIAAAPSVATADRLLACQISAHLAETNRANLRRLSVDVSGGEVTLRGNVSTFHEKQIAIQTCRMLAGIDRLIDAVEVAAMT
jgi:osmotically-inducible protein OsmY